MMVALRNLLVGKANDVSFYDHNTLYIGQHSRRRSFTIYRKDLELLTHPMPLNVYGRDYLLRQAEGLIRLELTLRGAELSDRRLDNPRAWSAPRAHVLMQRWTNVLVQARGRVADVDRIECLTPSLQQKLHGWLLGDPIAFTRGVSHETFRLNRSRVLRTTGIDVANHLTPEQQGDALMTVRELFEQGFGYRDHAHKWAKLILSVLP